MQLSLFLGLLLTLAAAQGATVPYTTDFEGPPGAEWSDTSLDRTVPATFTQFSGRFGNTAQSLTLESLTPGDAYRLNFDLYVLDRWEGNTGLDTISISVDGLELFRYTFNNVYTDSPDTVQSYPRGPDSGRVNMGFNGDLDSIYRNIEVGFTASSSTALIAFRGLNLPDLATASWGLDNVRVASAAVSPETTVYAVTLPLVNGIASATAIDSISLVFTRNLLPSSATNAANYLLREAGGNQTFGDSDDRLIGAAPSLIGGKTVKLALTPQPLQPGRYRLEFANLLDIDNAAVASYSKLFAVENPSFGIVENTSNDSIAGATVLSMSVLMDGLSVGYGVGTFVTTSDVDFWRFDAQAGDSVAVRVAPDFNPGSMEKSLLDSSGQSVFFNSLSGTIPTSGSYYIRVNHSYSTTPYTLAVDRSTRPKLEVEPNNTIASGTVLNFSIIGAGHEAMAAGCFAKDFWSADAGDFYKLGNLAAGNTIAAALAFPSGSILSQEKVTLSLFLGDTLLATNTASLNFTVAADGAYSIRVGSDVKDVRAEYLLGVVLTDNIPPVISSVSLPENGSVSTNLIDRFNLMLSEEVDPSFSNDLLNVFDLRSAGQDGTFGTTDDTLYHLECDSFASYPGAPYTQGLQINFRIADGPLQPGPCRFTVSETLHDRAGNSLSAPFVRTFYISNVPNFQFEGLNDGTAAGATALNMVEDPPGAGIRSGAGRGSLSSNNDEDYWMFPGKAGDRMLLSADFVGNPPQRNLTYTVRDPSANLITTFVCDWRTSSGDSAPVILPIDGNYSILVYRFYTGDPTADWASGEYRMRVTLAPSSVVLEAEPNDATSLPLNLEGSHGAGTALGYISMGDLGDSYRVENLVTGTVLNVTLEQPSSSGFMPQLRIFTQGSGWTPDVLGAPGATSVQCEVSDPAAAYYVSVANAAAVYAPTFDGKAGFARHFWGSGSDGLLSHRVIPASGDFTVEAWAFAEEAGRGYNRPIVAADGNFRLGSGPSGQILVGDSWTDTGVTFPVGGWHHLAVVRTASDAFLYVDGILRSSLGERLPSPLSDRFYLAYRYLGSNPEEHWKGGIDEVRIWRVARSQAEIIANMNHLLTGREEGLVAYWNFDNGEFSKITDATGHGYDIDVGGENVPSIANLPIPPGILAQYILHVDASSPGSSNSLDITVRNLTVEPVAPQAGNWLTIRWEELNSGPGTISQSFHERLRIINRSLNRTNLDRTLLVDAVTDGSIHPGDGRQRQYSFFVPFGLSGAGDFEVLIDADSADEIPEFNPAADGETNNRGSLIFTSTLPFQPDLYLPGVVGPASAHAGEPVFVRWTVRNQGINAALGPWKDQIFLSYDQNPGDDMLLGTFVFDGFLSPGAFYTHEGTVLMPSDRGPGEYWFIVKADAEGQIAEFDKGNNAAISSEHVLVLPSILLVLSTNRIPENAGGFAATGTVSRTGDLAASLAIALTSSDTAAATVPPQVIIPAGAASAQFTIAAVDDATFDPDQATTITAHASGFPDASQDLLVFNDEIANRPPVLSPIPDRTIPELSLFSFTVQATDPDAPANTLRFSLASGAPSGMSIDPASGLITWTPTEAQGPSVYAATVIVSDNAANPLSDSKSFHLTVTEVNTPPKLAAIPDAFLAEGQAYSYTATAADPDLPPNGLAFSVVSGPSGLTIDPTTGEIRWTLAKGQGGKRYFPTIQVTDNGSPPWNDAVTFLLDVAEVNTAPVFDPIADQTINEGTDLALQVKAVDNDPISSHITYSLAAGAPVGMAINSATGLLSWHPGESEGPGSYNITVIASDNGSPSLSGQLAFKLIVAEVNRPPALGSISDQTVADGSPLRLKLTATDPDVPANALHFSLGPGAPTGMTIDAVSGDLAWTPSNSEAGSIVTISAIVTDDGSPPLSDSKSFHIAVSAVNDPPRITLPSPISCLEDVQSPLAGISLDDIDAGSGNLRLSLAVAYGRLTFPALPGIEFEHGATSGSNLVLTANLALLNQALEQLVYLPATNFSGAETVTLAIDDLGNTGAGGPLSDLKTLDIEILPVNDAPVLSAIPDQRMEEGTSSGLIEFTAYDIDSSPEALAISADSSNPGLISPAGIQLSGAGTARSFRLVPGLGQTGMARITITASDGSASSSVQFTLEVLPVKPEIFSQPSGKTVLAGSFVEFTIGVLGTPPLTYQWQINGADIPDEIREILRITSAAAKDEGVYTALIRNRAGEVTSDPAVLTVVYPITITQQPLNTTNKVGETARLAVFSTGTEPRQCQWKRNGLDIPGATNDLLTIPNAQQWHSGTYTMLLSNVVGAVTSTPALLVIQADTPIIDRASITASGFSLGISGPLGSAYSLQASTDLATWTTLTNFTMGLDGFAFVDGQSLLLNGRFYRFIANPAP